MLFTLAFGVTDRVIIPGECIRLYINTMWDTCLIRFYAANYLQINFERRYLATTSSTSGAPNLQTD